MNGLTESGTHLPPKSGTHLEGESHLGHHPRYPAYKPSGVAWLGEIPTHWDMRKGRYLGDLIGSLDINGYEFDEGGNILFVKVDDLNQTGVGFFITDSNSKLTKVKNNVQSPTEKLILFPKRGAAIFTNKVRISNKPTFFDSNVMGWRIYDEANIEFIAYALLCRGLSDLADVSSVPQINNKHINPEKFPYPPLEEQRAIVAFLDEQTAVLDTLIREKQALIALLQEKRTAVISTAVTQGLDTAVAMKESGVEWIGRVPAHWQIIRLRYVVEKIVDYRGRTPEKVDYGIPLVTARNIVNGKIDFSQSQEFIREGNYDSWMVRGFPDVGDVLLTTEAPLGNVAQVDDTSIALAQRIVLLKTHKALVTNEYLKYYILAKAGQGELWSKATGSTAVGIKASWLRTRV